MLWHALQAERLKLRRTFLLHSTWLAPLLLVALATAIAFRRPEGGHSWGVWTTLTLGAWGRLLVFFQGALAGLLLFSQEHARNTWKLVYTQPIPRWIWLLGKQITLAALLLLSHLALVAFAVAASQALRWADPRHAFTPIPWGGLAATAAGLWLTSLPSALLGLLVCARKANPALPVALAILGLCLQWPFSETPAAAFYPWTLPGEWLGRAGVSPAGHAPFQLLATAAALSAGLMALGWALERTREVR